MGNCFGERDKRSKVEKASGSLQNNSYLTSTALSSISGTTTSQVSNSTTSNLTTPSSSNDSQWGNSSTPSIIYNKSSQLGDSMPSSLLHSFTYNELKGVTKNFRTDNLLGEGGFGSVFKGWMDGQSYTASRPGEGIVVAVKKLNPQSLQGHKEWVTEVHLLGQLHHPNLVKLIGYCGEDEHRLLVYEFLSRGSLENHLFRRGACIPWTVRMKIALGAAKGLGFLHEAKVIYRDFKTSNILLDSEYNAKLSDFGLAREGPTGNNTHVSTNVVGTLGYAAPEYVSTGHLTLSSDIYSFGVVLLEIISGRRAYDKTRPLEEQELVEWSRPYLCNKKKMYRLMDPRLDGQCSRIGFERASTLAYNCLHTDAKIRPLMKEAVEILEPLVNPRETMVRPLHPSSRISQR